MSTATQQQQLITDIEPDSAHINSFKNSTEPSQLLQSQIHPHLTINNLTTGHLTITSIPSFTVINSDTLGNFNKPNAIVRPVRRTVPLPGPFDSNDSTKFSLSKNGQEIEGFAKELDKKLRRLKKHNKDGQKSSNNSSKNGSNQDLIVKRPLFITTVPTGVFLPPVREQPFIQSKRVYAYATRPRIFTNQQLGQLYSDKSQISSNDREEKDFNPKLNGMRAFSKILTASKYHRDSSAVQPYKNVMFDKRVVRGSNYATATTTPWNPYFAYAGLLSGKETEMEIKRAETRRRQLIRKQCRAKNQRNVIGTPPAVAGRVHEHIQTEKYLEELFDKPPEYTVNTQTDLYLARPPSPPYFPTKIGIDVSTEILDGELFDFDKEVEPILETLIGHCVEQGFIEVAHEEEIAELKKQQEEYLSIREIDLAELRRLEAEELRLQAEKERRLRQDSIADELDAKMQERVTAAKLLQGHIAGLLPEVLENLEPLSDIAKKEDLEKNICPWLTEEVCREVGQIIDSREILTAIIQEIIKDRAAVYASYTESSSIVEFGEEECPNELIDEAEEEAESTDIDFCARLKNM